MATFKVLVRFQRADGYYPVYIRLTHNRGVKYIKTDKIVDFKNIDKKNHEVQIGLNMVWNGNMEEVYIDNIIPNMGIYLFSEAFRNHRFWLSIKFTRLLLVFLS